MGIDIRGGVWYHGVMIAEGEMRIAAKVGEMVRIDRGERRAKTGRILQEHGMWWLVDGCGWVEKGKCRRIRPSLARAERQAEGMDEGIYGDGEI